MDNGWITLAKVKVGDHVLTSPATGKLVQFSNGRGSGTLAREVTKIDKIPQGMGNAYVLRFAKGRHTEERYGTTHVWLAPAEEVAPEAEPHVTGDGVTHPTQEAAIEHANEVAATTGNIVAVEAAPEPAVPPKPTKPAGIGETEARNLIAALNAVLPMTSKDEYLPLLAQVKFETHDDQLVLIATDRFVLGSYRIPWFGGEVNTALGVDAAKDLLAFCRKVKPDVLPVGLKFAEREVEVDDGQRRTTLLLSDEAESFVNWRAILPARDHEDVTFGLDPQKIAQFVKAGDKGVPMRVTLKARLKPVLIEVGESFTGLIMPVRLPEATEPANTTEPKTPAWPGAERIGTPIEYRVTTTEDGHIVAAQAGKAGATVTRRPDGRVFIEGWDKGYDVFDTPHGWRIRVTSDGQVVVIGVPPQHRDKVPAKGADRPAPKRVEVVDGVVKVVKCATCKGFGVVRKRGENAGGWYKTASGAADATAKGNSTPCPSCSASAAAA